MSAKRKVRPNSRRHKTDAPKFRKPRVSFKVRIPQKGDKVTDNNRLIQKHGEVIGFIFDSSNPSEEVVQDVAVRFSRNPSHPATWYTLSDLLDKWNGNEYVIEPKPISEQQDEPEVDT